MSDNTETIRKFVEIWAKCDVDAVMEFFTEDAIYHNMPMDPLQGTDAIRAAINGFVGMSTGIEWELRTIAESASGVVLTERTDKFEIAGKWISLPVMGTFELEGGKISAWRDYFDMNQFQSQIG